MKMAGIPLITKWWLILVLVFAVLPWVAIAEDTGVPDQQLVDAAKQGNLAQVKTLLDQGAGVQNNHRGAAIALFVAAGGGHSEVVQLLLDRGTEIDVKALHGWTPLTHAAWKGRADVVKLLLSKGAEGNTRDNFCGTALLYAAWRKHADVVKLLKAHGAEVTLTVAAIMGDKTEVQRLIDAGAEVNVPDEGARTPLIEAVNEGHTDVVKLLLERGADPNEEDTGGRTALDYARMDKQEEIMAVLAQAGAHNGKQQRDRLSSAGKSRTGSLLKGQVVALSPRNLAIRPIPITNEGTNEVIKVEVGPKTRFITCRRPAPGEHVEVEYRNENGGNFAYKVRIISQ